MARFKWRAPYRRSVPSCSRILLHRRGAAEDELVVARRLQNALLHHAEFDLQNLLAGARLRSMRKTTTLSMRFMNSGENLRRAASTAVRSIFWSSLASICAGVCANPMVPLIISFISDAPRFEVMTMTHCERSTRRLSPKRQRGLVEDAQQQLPRASPKPSRFRRTAGSRASASRCATG